MQRIFYGKELGENNDMLGQCRGLQLGTPPDRLQPAKMQHQRFCVLAMRSRGREIVFMAEQARLIAEMAGLMAER